MLNAFQIGFDVYAQCYVSLSDVEGALLLCAFGKHLQLYLIECKAISGNNTHMFENYGFS